MGFYLKILKGNPKIYIVQCESYPNCYNTITELENDIKIIKPEEQMKIYIYI